MMKNITYGKVARFCESIIKKMEEDHPFVEQVTKFLAEQVKENNPKEIVNIGLLKTLYRLFCHYDMKEFISKDEEKILTEPIIESKLRKYIRKEIKNILKESDSEYIYLSNGDTAVELYNNGRAWIENGEQGEKLDNFGHKNYMSYLSAKDIAQWLSRDYGGSWDEISGDDYVNFSDGYDDENTYEELSKNRKITEEKNVHVFKQRSAVDDYEHDGDTENDVRKWRSLGAKVKVERPPYPEDDPSPILNITLEFSEEDIPDLISRAESSLKRSSRSGNYGSAIYGWDLEWILKDYDKKFKTDMVRKYKKDLDRLNSMG